MKNSYRKSFNRPLNTRRTWKDFKSSWLDFRYCMFICSFLFPSVAKGKQGIRSKCPFNKTKDLSCFKTIHYCNVGFQHIFVMPGTYDGWGLAAVIISSLHCRKIRARFPCVCYATLVWLLAKNNSTMKYRTPDKRRWIVAASFINPTI